ncbi:TPA: hypothetical protein IAD52_00685, partial [Candidatus Spyradomonas excrementavium]|nr:hypothetical protein [Candidatus Spyradomonas excrementavium]
MLKTNEKLQTPAQMPETPVNTMISRGGWLKSLAVAALAGCALFAQGQSALAGEFPLNSETAPLDFVKDNQKTDNSPKLTLKDVNLTRETACATGFAVDINELYTLTPATAEDYDYKTDTINADGTVTTNYYKITLNPENAGSSENIKWTQTDAAGANTIAVTLPNNETAYLQYSYTAPDGYTTTGTRVTSPSSANSTKMVFSGINNAKSYTGSNDYGSDDTSYGSDVNKSGSDDIKSVTTLTTTSTYTSVSGDASTSANADASCSSSSTIYGGAISNTNTSAVDITADFDGNSVTQNATGGNAYGGTAKAYAGDSTVYGGTASSSINYSTVGRWQNYERTSGSGSTSAHTVAYSYADASASADASTSITSTTLGGAIANQNGAKLGNINGNFTENHSSSTANGGYASGGVARAYGGTATTYGGSASASTSVYISWNYGSVSTSATASATSDAYASADATTYASASSYATSYAYGGAISNQGTIGNITGDFINNYSEAKAILGSASSGSAYSYSGSANANRGSSSASASAGSDFGVSSDNYYNSNSASSSVSGSSSSNSTQYDSDKPEAFIHPDETYQNPDGTWGGIGAYSLSANASTNAQSYISNGASESEYASSSTSAKAYAYGGAIYNASSKTIGNITGSFNGNYAQAEAATTSEAHGGAI